jgi:hypothetical protein
MFNGMQRNVVIATVWSGICIVTAFTVISLYMKYVYMNSVERESRKVRNRRVF